MNIYTHIYFYLKIVFIGKREVTVFEQDSIMMTVVLREK